MSNSQESVQEAHKGDIITGLHSSANPSTNMKQESSTKHNIEAYISDNNPHIQVGHDNLASSTMTP